jgi:hypothetical protein
MGTYVLEDCFGSEVTPSGVLSYAAAILTAPAFFTRFHDDLQRPGLRLPITASVDFFKEAKSLGYRIIWLHTYGERMVDPTDDRPAGAPRLSEDRRPLIPADGAIPSDEYGMPDDIEYESDNNRLVFRDEHGNAAGAVDRVTSEMWNYRVSSDTPLIRQWFIYRKKDRSRPLIGDRSPPSDLNQIQTQSCVTRIHYRVAESAQYSWPADRSGTSSSITS